MISFCEIYSFSKCECAEILFILMCLKITHEYLKSLKQKPKEILLHILESSRNSCRMEFCFVLMSQPKKKRYFSLRTLQQKSFHVLKIKYE